MGRMWKLEIWSSEVDVDEEATSAFFVLAIMIGLEIICECVDEGGRGVA